MESDAVTQDYTFLEWNYRCAAKIEKRRAKFVNVTSSAQQKWELAVAHVAYAMCHDKTYFDLHGDVFAAECKGNKLPGGMVTGSLMTLPWNTSCMLQRRVLVDILAKQNVELLARNIFVMGDDILENITNYPANYDKVIVDGLRKVGQIIRPADIVVGGIDKVAFLGNRFVSTPKGIFPYPDPDRVGKHLLAIVQRDTFKVKDEVVSETSFSSFQSLANSYLLNYVYAPDTSVLNFNRLSQLFLACGLEVRTRDYYIDITMREKIPELDDFCVELKGQLKLKKRFEHGVRHALLKDFVVPENSSDFYLQSLAERRRFHYFGSIDPLITAGESEAFSLFSIYWKQPSLAIWNTVCGFTTTLSNGLVIRKFVGRKYSIYTHLKILDDFLSYRIHPLLWSLSTPWFDENLYENEFDSVLYPILFLPELFLCYVACFLPVCKRRSARFCRWVTSHSAKHEVFNLKVQHLYSYFLAIVFVPLFLHGLGILCYFSFAVLEVSNTYETYVDHFFGNVFHGVYLGWFAVLHLIDILIIWAWPLFGGLYWYGWHERGFITLIKGVLFSLIKNGATVMEASKNNLNFKINQFHFTISLICKTMNNKLHNRFNNSFSQIRSKLKSKGIADDILKPMIEDIQQGITELGDIVTKPLQIADDIANKFSLQETKSRGDYLPATLSHIIATTTANTTVKLYYKESKKCKSGERRMTFCQPLVTVNASTTIVQGSILYATGIDESMFDSTQLAADFDAYEQWRVNKMRFIILPKCTSGQSGGYFSFTTPDANDFFQSDGLIRSAILDYNTIAKHTGTEHNWLTGVGSTDHVCKRKLFTDSGWSLFPSSGSDVRMSSAGAFVVVSTGTLALTTNSLFSVYCEGDITFSDANSSDQHNNPLCWKATGINSNTLMSSRTLYMLSDVINNSVNNAKAGLAAYTEGAVDNDANRSNSSLLTPNNGSTLIALPYGEYAFSITLGFSASPLGVTAVVNVPIQVAMQKQSWRIVANFGNITPQIEFVTPPANPNSATWEVGVAGFIRMVPNSVNPPFAGRGIFDISMLLTNGQSLQNVSMSIHKIASSFNKPINYDPFPVGSSGLLNLKVNKEEEKQETHVMEGYMLVPKLIKQ